MLKIVPLYAVILALPVAVKIIKSKNEAPVNPVAFRVTQALVPTKISAAKQAVDTDTARLKQNGWYGEAMKKLAQKEYEFKPATDGGNYFTPNRHNNLQFSYSEKGFTVKPHTTKFPVGKPKPGALPGEIKYKTLPDWKIAFNLNKEQIGEGQWQVAGNKAEYITDNITVQYINNSAGMRQNFIVKAPATAGEDEKIMLNIETALQIKLEPNRLQFANKQGVVMSYDQLKVWDANGQPLEASFEKNSRDYCIHVQSKNAVYPITIDPLTLTPATTLQAGQANAMLGFSVASAGDVNGDGYSDVIVGAIRYSNDQTNEGAAFIYHGSAAGLSTTPAIMLEDTQTDAQFGWSVASAGDVNGDGYSDVVVGALTYDYSGADRGVIFIYHGSPTGINATVSSYFSGPRTGSHHGFSVSTAGDVNGDGYSDVVVGAPLYASGGWGMVTVYMGSPSGISGLKYETTSGANEWYGASVACAGDINGDGYSDIIVGAPNSGSSAYPETGGFYVYLGSASFNFTMASRTTGIPYYPAAATNYIRLGASVAGAGDVNGDGYSDVIVGAPGWSDIPAESREGYAVIYHGSATGFHTPPTLLQLNKANSGLGSSVASAGDINGDGYSDVIVGSTWYDDLYYDEGAAFVYYGSATGIVSTPYATGKGNQATAHYGHSVASAGDVNGDGYSDVIVGAPDLNESSLTAAGAAFLFHGSPSGLTNSASFYVESNSNEARLGHSIAYAGDVNGDGYGDVVIGLPGYTNGQPYEGAIHVYHGTATGMSASPAIVLEMNQANSSLGWSVAAAGDVNSDGYADIIVGAINYSNGNTAEGIFRIYHGSATGITGTPAITVEGNQNNAQLGVSVACAGDVNGDGFSDVIVGANGYTNGQTSEGVAYIYHGSAAGISATPAVTLEKNQTGAQFGWAVSSAGDVNGDGFSDVIVGAKTYTNDQATEGAAFLYTGSATGINTATPTLLEGVQASAEFGFSVTGGDVNGDGYSDVIVGSKLYSNVQTQEGSLFVYHGSAAGISTTATTILESNMPLARLGSSVSVCDVNNDGYIDVATGAIRYSNAETDEGAVFVYYGSAAGLNSTAVTTIESNVAGANFGWATGAGDINGDGFSDVMVGAPALANNALAAEGAIYAYYGNSAGKRNNLNLYNTDLTTRLDKSNFAGGSFGIGLFAKSFLGKAKGKLVWETSRSFNAFSGTPITNSVLYTSQQSTYTDLGLTGIELKNAVAKVSSPFTKVRARIKYSPTTAFTGQVYSPWRYVPEQASGLSIGVLPVDLISFKAEWLQKGSSAQIKFITDNEDGVCCYEVEKSLDGVQFTTLGKLTAKNTSSRNNYSYIDNNATAQKQYYRLKTIFTSGTVEYSNLQWLQSNASIEVIVFPNPASDVLQLRLNNNYTSMNVQVINAAGQTIKQLNNLSTAGQTVTIPVSNLAAGTYFLYLQSGSEKQVLQFIKK